MGTHINLLDWRAARRERRLQDFKRQMVAAAAIGVAIALLWYMQASGVREDQEARNDLLRSEIKALDQKIKEIAKKNGVPTVENKPLARALYATATIGEAIPLELFVAVAEEAGHRVDRRHIERLLAPHRWENRRQATGQHRLPSTRWPAQEHVVAAGSCHLERSPGVPLAADIGQIDRCPQRVGLERHTLPGFDHPVLAEVVDQVEEMLDWQHGERVDQRGLRGVVAGDHERVETCLSGRDGQRQHPAHRPDAPIEP